MRVELKDTKFYDLGVHRNACNHPPEAYVGTTECATTAGWAMFDVFIYQDTPTQQHVCIRYGREGSEYYSPGEVWEFLRRTVSDAQPAYWAAKQLIEENCKLVPKII